MSRPWIIGVDPSLTATGIAYRSGDLATIPDSRAKADDRRLESIFTALRDIEADFAVIEDLPTHAQGAGKTGMAQGAVRIALLLAGVPYVTVTPAGLKTYATGKGNATKADMRMAWYQRTGQDIRDDNQVDAAWLRALGLDHAKHALFALPAKNRTALDKIAWTAA